MQSRRVSLLEAFANVVAGYAIAAVTTALALPWWGYAISGADALGISAVFTAVSLVRGYCLRRLFNWFAMRSMTR